jgi:hypothetical protein
VTVTSEPIALIALTVVASALAGSAAIEFARPSFVARAQASLQWPRGLVRSAASVQLVAAMFLIVPQTRIWGIAASAAVIVVGLVLLLFNGRLWWCVPVTALLAALIPVTLAL